MNEFKHILVATDFGEPANRALDFALMLASKFESKVTIVHASWLPPVAYAAYAEGLLWPTDEMARGAKEALQTLVSGARKRYSNVEGLVVIGEPRGTILDVAQERGADLIAMGTHGRRGLSRVFLGSVAERVVRVSPVPVLTIGVEADHEATATSGPPRAPLPPR
jgi:nucleotide-binding universal stress UspA family protein